jgi:hypothetical protein
VTWGRVTSNASRASSGTSKGKSASFGGDDEEESNDGSFRGSFKGGKERRLSSLSLGIVEEFDEEEWWGQREEEEREREAAAKEAVQQAEDEQRSVDSTTRGPLRSFPRVVCSFFLLIFSLKLRIAPYLPAWFLTFLFFLFCFLISAGRGGRGSKNRLQRRGEIRPRAIYCQNDIDFLTFLRNRIMFASMSGSSLQCSWQKKTLGTHKQVEGREQKISTR